MGNENQEKILYLCDGYGCEAKCELNGECYKTFDINHAKNFVKRNGHFVEKQEVKEMENREKVMVARIRVKGAKKYKKDAKSIKKSAKMTDKAVRQLNKSMKKFIELREELL